jgi:hypothetical protein
MSLVASIFGRFAVDLFRACALARTRGVVVRPLLILGFAVSSGTQAATSFNAQSPLGSNLEGISQYSSENPFLNVFKNSNAWTTSNGTTYDTGEEAYLQLDSDGYPTTLVATSSDPNRPQLFTLVQANMYGSMPSTPNGIYPAGQYIVTYQGAGTLQFGGDATLVSSSAGQYVINVATASGVGIFLKITSTDPLGVGNYIRNIQVVQAGNAAALAAGQVFTPGFLSMIQNFHVLRFMGWLSITDNPLTSWANRPLQSNAFWGTTKGGPIETAIQLANAVSADAWLNIPAMVDNNYITQMATLVHSQLGSAQKVYLEYSNETWNYSFSQAAWIQAQGQAEWPSFTGSTFQLNRDWYGQRVAQMCDIWKSVWGADANRVVCVLAAQSNDGSGYTATESLNCPLWTAGAPCSSHGIGAVAIAPYFGGAVPSAWTSQSDGGLASLFASLTSQNDPSIPAGGWLGSASGFEALYASVLAPYKLPMLAYEGGQSFEGFPTYSNGSAMVNLFAAANRDPRMGTAYTAYLNQWKANGGQLFMHLQDTSPYTQYGEWGALESFMQTTIPLSSAPPKWQALENFITNNACWWSGCVGTLGTTTTIIVTPMPPTNVTVH